MLFANGCGGEKICIVLFHLSSEFSSFTVILIFLTGKQGSTDNMREQEDLPEACIKLKFRATYSIACTVIPVIEILVA